MINYISLGLIAFGCLCVATGIIGSRDYKNDASDLLRYGIKMIAAGVALKMVTL